MKLLIVSDSSMRFFKLIFILTLSGIGLSRCSSDDSPSPVDQQVKSFIWSSMNVYYYWQSDVPNLSDSKIGFGFNSFIDTYATPEVFFYDLLYKDDRFSWIVDDYEELEAAFQGVSTSFGYELGLDRVTPQSDDIFAYIKYVVPNGPAEDAGLVRGDIFNKVDGIQLTVENYVSLLLDQSSYTITLANRVEDDISETDEEINLTSIELSENPLLMAEVLEVESSKIGYMVYNQFVNNNTYHEELNTAMGQFVSEGISDLILDLRYNGGGSLLTTRILASMIYGKANGDDILGAIVYNDKLADFNQDISFLAAIPILNSNGEQTSSLSMNRLNINRLFILTSGNSASASEFIIAGLLPYMDVTLIGTTTVGKNVASVTLYDSENYSNSTPLNPNHKYAIQPIISQLANSDGFTDYIDGFDPDVEVNELDYLEDLKPLGDLEEPLLAEALSIITGTARLADMPRSRRKALPFKQKKHVETTLIEGELIPENLFETQNQ